MNKRVPYTIIPKYFKTIHDLENELNIKVIYWKLYVKKTPLSEAAKFKILCWTI